MLNDKLRIRLHFGPYGTPKFKYGHLVWDEIRGWVRIVGISDSPIPWPIGSDGRTKSLVLYGDLVKALMNESGVAVRHWWGLSGWHIRKYRRALNVPTANFGARWLWRAQAFTPEFRAAQQRGLIRCREPEICQKISAAHRGRKRPEEVGQKVSAALTGRVRSAKHRRSLSIAHKLRGTRPPKAGRPWTDAENVWLFKLTPADVAKRTGRSLYAVYHQRRLLGLTRQAGPIGESVG